MNIKRIIIAAILAVLFAGAFCPIQTIWLEDRLLAWRIPAPWSSQSLDEWSVAEAGTSTVLICDSRCYGILTKAYELVQ